MEHSSPAYQRESRAVSRIGVGTRQNSLFRQSDRNESSTIGSPHSGWHTRLTNERRGRLRGWIRFPRPAPCDFMRMARGAGFTACDMIVKVLTEPMQSNKWKTAYHARKRHCFWIVCRNSASCERRSINGSHRLIQSDSAIPIQMPVTTGFSSSQR